MAWDKNGKYILFSEEYVTSLFKDKYPCRVAILDIDSVMRRWDLERSNDDEALNQINEILRALNSYLQE